MDRNVTFLKKEEAMKFLNQCKIYCMANGHITVGDVNDMFAKSDYSFIIDNEGYVDLVTGLDARFGWTSLEKAMVFSTARHFQRVTDPDCVIDLDTYYIKFPPCNYIQEKETLYYEKSNDMVNHPSHYTHGSMETWDKIREALGDEGFCYYCWGTMMKYLDRADYKVNKREDLLKAVAYAEKMKSVMEENENVFKN